MSPVRLGVLAAGLVFFSAVAALDVAMARAAGSVRPLMVAWILVPAPLVFAGLVLRRSRSRTVAWSSATYLVVSPLTTLAALLAVGWIGSERAIHPGTCSDLPTLSDYPELEAAAETVHFKSQDGTDLVGWFIPGQTAKTVLLHHGYSCKRDEMLPHADILHRAGYTVLLYDFRNRGESAGDAVTLAYYERGDALGAIDYLKTRPDVDQSGFGALGISQGAATTIRAAAASPDIKAIVAECSFKTLDSVIGQSFEHFIGLPAFPFATVSVWLAERRVGIDSSDVAPEREVAAISPRPVFIMHGELDTTISPDDSRAIFAAAKEPKEFWLIPNSAHAQGARKAKGEYEQRVVAFFDANLK